MSNELFYGDSHISCVLKEAESLDILVGGVNPGAYEGNFKVYLTPSR